jgi:hypothetical protein
MRTGIATAALVAAALVPAAARADTEADIQYRGWGPRVGITSGPDQVHFGTHVDFGNIAERVRFQPNFELGIGDNFTIGALNFEAAYRFADRWDQWAPYLGGGVGLNFTSNDNGRGDEMNTGAGLNFLGGIEKGLSSGDRFFTELKLGMADSPEFKVTSGWTFYH